MIRHYFRILLIGLICAPPAIAQEKPQPKRLIERAKRPIFSERDWDGIYFENLFDQGLVGDRPKDFGMARASKKPPAPAAGDESENASPAGWSQWISGQTLEDEVKRMQLELDELVTTPENFKTENAKVRASFAQLATWFGIIAEFDDSVRWQSDAAGARDMFAQAAASAQNSSDEAFASAKSARDQLAELVRGEKLRSDAGRGSAEMNWTHWADRVSLMTRLETAFTERLKPWTSNESEFRGHADELPQEAEIVAAVSHVLLLDGLDDAEDEDYVRHSNEMTQAARDLRTAVENLQFEPASNSVNRMGQACSNCHEAFR